MASVNLTITCEHSALSVTEHWGNSPHSFGNRTKFLLRIVDLASIIYSHITDAELGCQARLLLVLVLSYPLLVYSFTTNSIVITSVCFLLSTHKVIKKVIMCTFGNGRFHTDFEMYSFVYYSECLAQGLAGKGPSIRTCV